MRARTLLAVLPVAFATAFVPASVIPTAAADDAYPSQNCATALPSEQVANAYTVMGQVLDKEYAFVDVVQRPDALEVCLRVQFRTGGYNWEGDYLRLPGVSASTATEVLVDGNTAACTNELDSGAVGNPGDPYYTPYRVAIEETATNETVCITVGGINLRVSGTLDGTVSGIPDYQSDCCGIYDRVAAFPNGGSESSLCGTPKPGSSYVVTQNSASFVRRDEPTNSVCFRSERGSRAIGGRVDTFQAAGYQFVGLDASVCPETVFTSGMVPPLFVRISTSSGFDPNAEGYLCAQVNGTSVSLHRDPANSPGVPTLHFDA